MIKSALHSENIEQHLRERFFLERELMGQRISNSRGEKSTNNKRILEDIFIEKVLQDPYFSIYVCKMIEESNFNLNDVLAYAQYIILEKYLDTSTLFDTTSGDKTSFYSTQIESGIDGLIDRFSIKPEIADLKYNDYYDSLWTKGDKAVLKAIEATRARNEIINERMLDKSPLNWDRSDSPHLDKLIGPWGKRTPQYDGDWQIYEMNKNGMKRK